jgi:GTP-binding protein HflX
MKRHWQSQMKKIKDKIKKHTVDRMRQLERRAKNGLQTVSIIGYTNAGKTSLFNLLTGKKNVVQNALFVTLDSSTGKIFLPKSKKELLLTDTIGFIKNLPPSLIDAFKSTLLESMHADTSDKYMQEKIEVVEQILYDLRAEHKKRIYIFNKMDNVNGLNKSQLLEEYKEFTPHCISVKKQEGISQLISEIEKLLELNLHVSSTVNKRKPLHY